MKIVTLDETTYNDYATNHKYANFYQTVEYANVMRRFGFNTHYIGFRDDNNALVGASLILYKNFGMSYKYAYAPRGFLIDYTDKELVKEIAIGLKRLLSKQRFIFLKIDPPVIMHELNSDGKVIYANKYAELIIGTLKSNGFAHLGFNNLFETMKPRSNAFVKLTPNYQELFESLDKKVRNRIRRAEKMGVEIIKHDENNLDVTKIFEFIKNKHNRSKEYYQELYRIFSRKNMIDIYYSKIDTKNFIIRSQEAYNNELMLNDKLKELIQAPDAKEKEKRKIINMKMESDKALNNFKNNIILATRLSKEYPEGLIIGGCIIIKYKNGVNLLIDGFNKEFSQFNSNYLMKWEIIKEYSQKGYQYMNLNGVTGDFVTNTSQKYSGMNDIKLGYNSTVIQYIGEFDLVINPTIYNLKVRKVEAQNKPQKPKDNNDFEKVENDPNI